MFSIFITFCFHNSRLSILSHMRITLFMITIKSDLFQFHNWFLKKKQLKWILNKIFRIRYVFGNCPFYQSSEPERRRGQERFYQPTAFGGLGLCPQGSPWIPVSATDLSILTILAYFVSWCSNCIVCDQKYYNFCETRGLVQWDVPNRGRNNFFQRLLTHRKCLNQFLKKCRLRIFAFLPGYCQRATMFWRYCFEKLCRIYFNESKVSMVSIYFK